MYRHNEQNHKRKIDALKVNQEKQGKIAKVESAIPNFFSRMMKEENMKIVSKDDQLHGEALLVQWVSQSLRPFKMVEDNGFLSCSRFLCRLRGQFNVPT